MDALPPLDYLLQTGWAVPEATLDQLKKKSSSLKNVHVHYGNRLLSDIERCVENDALPLDPYRVDEVWTSPHYSFALPYFRTYYQTPKAFILPYIWSPRYIRAHHRIWKEANGRGCRYDPLAPKSLCVLEPNLNITKNCIPSIFIVEKLFLENPKLFESFKVFCTSVIGSKNYFRKLMWNLELQKAGKVTFLSRQVVSKIFADGSNVLVSHQLMNALNYTYLEAMYLDIPVVHNSEFIKDCGYYYPGYDVEAGAVQLKKALLEHDSNLETYRAQAERVMWRYSPKNPIVIEGYKKLLG